MKFRVGDLIVWEKMRDTTPMLIISIRPINNFDQTMIATVELKPTGGIYPYFLTTLEGSCIRINHYNSKLGKILYK